MHNYGSVAQNLQLSHLLLWCIMAVSKLIVRYSHLLCFMPNTCLAFPFLQKKNNIMM